MNKHVNKLIRIFGLQQFSHWFSIGIIVPVLTLLLMEKNLDLFQIGICMAVYTAVIFLLEIPTGGLADQIGRVKVYLISIGFSILAMSILLIGKHFFFAYLSMGVLGIARCLSTGTLDAWFIDQFHLHSTQGNLQSVLAKIEIWITLGLGFGSLFGGVLPMIARYTNLGVYTLNIVVIIILNLGVAVYTLFWIKEQQSSQSISLILGFQNLPVILKDALKYGFGNTGVLLLISATAFWGFAIVGLENYWQPQVKMILGSSKQSWVFGVLSSGYFFAAALGSFLITSISTIFNKKYTLILFFFRLGMGICFIILALQTDIFLFGIVYFILFMQNGMLNSPHQSLFHKIVPSEKRSTLISLESFMMSVGAMCGSLILGWISKTYSISSSWIIAGIVFSCSGFLYLIFGVSSANNHQGFKKQAA